MPPLRTESESIFEEFCVLNNITYKKIEESSQPVPDYEVYINGQYIFIEIKQIDEDYNFTLESGSRTVGSHIRKKIEQSRKQAQAASSENKPFILLAYNNLDKMQLFGTEQHDFIDAMYGETTVLLDTTKNIITDSFQGRNRSLGNEKNTSFSAVGNIKKTHKGIAVHIYENTFAKNKIDFSKLPTYIEATKIQL